MKQLLQSQARHYLWANQQIAAVLQTLPEAEFQQTLTGSFPSVFRTILHCYDADVIWWQRVKLVEQIQVPSKSFEAEGQVLVSLWLQQSQLWYDYVQGLSDRQLEHEVMYYNSDKKPFKEPLWQILTHLFAHAQFHRGQLVNHLRALGISKIPSTDFITLARKVKMERV